MAFDHFGGHFGEPIVEDRPLVTRPLGMAFEHFGGHFGEPIVEASCLGTGSFEVALSSELSRISH